MALVMVVVQMASLALLVAVVLHAVMMVVGQLVVGVVDLPVLLLVLLVEWHRI